MFRRGDSAEAQDAHNYPLGEGGDDIFMKYELAKSASDIPMDHVVTHEDKVVGQSGIG